MYKIKPTNAYASKTDGPVHLIVEVAPIKSPTPIAPPSEIISICPAVIDRRNAGADFFITNQIPFSLSFISFKVYYKTTNFSTFFSSFFNFGGTKLLQLNFFNKKKPTVVDHPRLAN